jgi:hypothetical protein
MDKFSSDLHQIDRTPQSVIESILRGIVLLMLFLFALTSTQVVFAQAKPQSVTASSSCSRENALEIIQQQIDLTKTMDDTAQRITILIRAAALLWPYQQEKARVTFTEAFDLASGNSKERGDQSKTDRRALLLETPDQRYVVIRAIAKLDAAWAKKLTEQLLQQEHQDEAASSMENSLNDLVKAERLLDSATSLLSSDVNAATNLARTSLRYPASVRLSAFLYKLAELNQTAADQFYREALSVYQDKPLREFLYLSAYPFGYRDAGDMPVFGGYTVPANFTLNNSLQRLFVQTLLRRAQQSLETPLNQGDDFNGLPGTGHIWQVLMRLEPQVQKSLPDLFEAVEQERWNIFASLSQETQRIFSEPNRTPDSSPTKTFDEQLEAAQNEANINRRDELTVTAILNSPQTESLDSVRRAIDKVSDSNVRGELLDWLYFSRAQSAIKGKRFDEAERLASKVEELDQRAYLHSEIAKELLQSTATQTQAREVLDEAITEANKAPNTITTARILLTASYLYTKIDFSRSISVLRDAISCINHLESPDFSRTILVKKIEGKNFRRNVRFQTLGFDPENTFREMGKINFDDTLSLTHSFTDKSLRALTTLALTDICLQQAQQQEKAEKAKGKAKS